MRDDHYSSEVGNRHFALEQGGIAPNTSVAKTTASKHLMGERQEAHGQLEKGKKKRCRLWQSWQDTQRNFFSSSSMEWKIKASILEKKMEIIYWKKTA